MKNFTRFGAFAGLALSLVACNLGHIDSVPQKDTNQCSYDQENGFAEVTQIDTPAANLDSVQFRWLDSMGNSTEPRQWGVALTPDCVGSQGIAVGTRIAAIRSNIVNGACNPVTFDFPNLPSGCQVSLP
jgi:hypothetical protein